MSDTLSAWSVGGGFYWIQTRNAGFARKLQKRSDTKLVAVGVSGGYLRTFKMRRSPAFMHRLVARYLAANARFQEMEGAQDGTKHHGKVTVPDEGHAPGKRGNGK